jgi:steroid 5-alpha reductase family enzyme
MDRNVFSSINTAVAASSTAAFAAFLVAWARQLRTRDATSVDVLWTLGIAATTGFHALVSGGWLPRRILVVILVSAWAGRLTAHLARRIGRGEDSRYAELRRRAGARAPSVFLAVYLLQAALVVALGLVFVPLLRASEAGWRANDALAVALFAAALLGESAADRQLQRWRNDPAHRGRACRTGLWRLSRHPNYFFEWLHWCAYPLLGLGLAHGAWLWLAPAGMFLLMRFVTGVPPAEAQALRSRGEDYREYQRTTNAFFPLPRRPLGACPT